jgi:PAS domain S-box-containing protein
LKNSEPVDQIRLYSQKAVDAGAQLYNRRIVISFIVIIVLIISAGLISFFLQERQERNGIESDLDAIAQIKIQQITSWRQERLADADLMKDSIFYAEAVSEWLNNPDPEIEIKLHTRLEALVKGHPYKDVLLTNPDGKILFSLNQTTYVDPNTLAQLPEAFKKNRSVMMDLHKSLENGKPQIDIIAPLSITRVGIQHAVAAIILTLDPDDSLYPLIEIWPLPNRTAETLLVRKEGDSVLFLNNIKFKPDSALTLSIPLSQSETPAVQAVLGKTGIFRGTDYRGEKVISMIRSIENTPWFIVAKIDTSEAFSMLRLNSALILGLTTVLLLIVLMLLAYYVQRRRRTTFELLYQSEREKEAILKHFEYLVKYANDMIILIGQSMHVIETNDRAREVYGYNHEELTQLIIDDLVAPDYLITHKQRMKDLTVGDRNLYQSVHQTKNGTTFPVEISAVYIKVEGQLYLQWVVRDITERKMAEQMLINAKNELGVKVAERTSELAKANTQLEAFAARMVRIQEEEKKRIARDLHDQIGQSLTALKLMISQALRLPADKNAQILGEAQQLLIELMGQVREMSLNLRPSMLDDLGLLPTLNWHLERYEKQTGIKVIFNQKDLQRKLPPNVTETAYRVVQEALNNVSKYAGVSEVRIDAWTNDLSLTVRIEDSGKGFNPATVINNISFGLRGMSERISSIGGSLQIVSEPGSGTILTAVIPLDRDTK